MRRGWTVFAAVASLALAIGLSPCAARDSLPHTQFARLTGHTSIPYGWVDFCRRYTGECDGPVLLPQDIVLTAAALRDIERVNEAVNKSIIPVTDMDHWGVEDQWDYPTDGRGDCEDYALEKRRELIAAGYPRQALLLTVVKDHAGEGHAVLTVRTEQGEYVLDNMTDALLAWDATGYRFVKRQSQADQNVWESIGPVVAAPLYTAQQGQLPKDMRR